MTERLSHQRTDPLDSAVSPPAQPNGASCPEPATISADASPVVDTWPGLIPVTQAEIEVLETFLGELLDEILGGAINDH